MFLNKFFLGIFLLGAFCSQSASALTDQEKEKNVMEELATYSLAGSALKIVTYNTLHGISSDPLDNNTTMNVYLELEPYTYSLFDPTSDFFVKIDDTKELQEILERVKVENIAASQRYERLTSWVGEIGFELDMLSLTTNTYDLVQNFSKAIDSNGSVHQEAITFGEQNVFDTYLAASQLIAQTGQLTSESTVETLWNKNTFAKGLVRRPDLSRAQILDVISLGAYLESTVYKYLKDNAIEEINYNIFIIHKNTLESRQRIVNQLSELYYNKENLNEVIVEEDIHYILKIHNALSTVYSEVPGSTYLLSQIFRDLSENTIYLNNFYSVNTFSELANDQKIFVALDALKEMAVKEDLELQNYLETTIGNTDTTVADIVVEGFQENSIYDIYNTESLMKKMFIYKGTSYSPYFYYNILFKVSFNSAIATRIQFMLTQEGREIGRMKEAQPLKQEKHIFSKRLPIPEGSLGDSVAVHFDKDVYYRDKVFANASLGLPYYLVYQVEGEASSRVEAMYDILRGTLVFTSPRDEAYEMYEIEVTQSPRWEGDNELRLFSYTLPVGDTGVWAENLTDESFGSNEQNTTKLLLKTGQTISYVDFDDGYYQKGITRDYSRSLEGVVTDNVTKLEWQDDYSDNSDTIKQGKWQEAIDYCNALQLDGGNWRLPSLVELETIVDDGTGNPAVTEDIFNNIQTSYSRYWTSTPYAYNTAYAWYVDFYRGVSNNDIKTDSRTDIMHLHYIRCVRDGQ